MASSLQQPLQGTVHVDKFMIGGIKEQKRGRSKGPKKLIAVALEILDSVVERAYAEIIRKCIGKRIKKFFLNKYVSKEAKVISDGMAWVHFTKSRP